MTRFATLLTFLLLPGLAFAQKEVTASSASNGGGPENDNLADAITITGNGEYLSSVTTASSEANEVSASCQTADSNQSVWWVYTPATDGTITLDTNGSIEDDPHSSIHGHDPHHPHGERTPAYGDRLQRR
ncbi:MAG: hypothetical protein AAGI52_03875 [Bacteroidota bacterium]